MEWILLLVANESAKDRTKETGLLCTLREFQRTLSLSRRQLENSKSRSFMDRILEENLAVSSKTTVFIRRICECR